jgi:hypothetical protein
MTYPAQPPYPPQGQPQPGYAPAPGYAPQPQYAPQPPAFQQPQYAPQQPQFQQPQYAPAAPAPAPVRASLDEFSDQPTGGGGGAVTKFFKGRPQGSWLQLRVTRDLNSSDITQQQNDGVLQFFKTNGVPDPTKPKLVMIIKTEVLASSDPQGASVAFPDGAAAVWLKGLTKDALVASIGAAGLPDPDTIFRKGKIGGSIITMISAGEKPPNNPMFSATKLYNFQYQPGGNEMSAFQEAPAAQYREGGATAPVQQLPPTQVAPPAAAPTATPPAAPPQPPAMDPGPAQYAPPPTAPAPMQQEYAPPPTQLPPPPPPQGQPEYAPQGYAPAPSAAAPPLPPAPAGGVPATPSYAPQPPAPPAPPQAPQGYAPQPPAPPAPSPLDAERANTLARLRGGQQ